MPSFLSLNAVPRALRRFTQLPWLRELLLWCLPALLCGGVLRALLVAHFPYGYIHPDSPDFLVTADRYLNYHRFVLHGKKSFLGPVLFLLPMILKLPSLLIIPWAQHLFGLIYTLMAGALVRWWTVFWKWWIVPVTLLITINPAVLWYEHALISEFQYLWCVTALVLAGTAYALRPTRARFILLLLALLLTAGSRPEGKLYVMFCLLLVALVHWGAWRRFALFGGITFLFCLLTWLSTRNTQAGLLLYATVLPLAPETSKIAPDFTPLIAPLRARRIAAGSLAIPNLVSEEKEISAIVYPYLKARGESTKGAGAFCQRLAVEAALHQPLSLPLLALNKFLFGTATISSGDFSPYWMQQVQLASCTYKPWMVKLMPRLTGLKIHSQTDLEPYLQKEFSPLSPDWFIPLQQAWFAATTHLRIPWPGEIKFIPGIPLFYLLGGIGMLAALVRPGSLQKLHFAWVLTLAFAGSVVMLTGVVNPRYRFLFETFFLIYLFVFADGLAVLCLRRKATAPALVNS